MSNFAMHISLNAQEKDYIKSLLKYTLFAKNTPLLAAGEKCRNIYFVQKGCLRVFYADQLGIEHNIYFAPENWWAVDMSSFSKQTPAFSSISTIEETIVYFIDYSTLEELYTAVPKFERFFRILTQNGFDMYQGRITTSLSQSAEERYMQFRKQYPGLEQRITQKHIASYLGITPVFLSRIRKRNQLHRM
ncbi:MAG: Crp/Fnr family transcriptional regulator [Pedobacter sp.]